MDKLSCIYVITNTVNKKQYVGQTSDYYQRIKAHEYALKKGNSQNTKLQNAVNRYGFEAFLFDILEPCAVEDLDEKEIFWIKSLNTVQDGYNITEGGSGFRGCRPSPDNIEKLRQRNRERIYTDEQRRQISERMKLRKGELCSAYGIPWSVRISKEGQESVRRQASERLTGSKNPNYGKHMSEEHKNKLYKARKLHDQIYGNSLKGRSRPDMLGTNNCNCTSVVLLNTGEIFPVLQWAADKYHVRQSCISANIHHNIPSAGEDDNGQRMVWVTEAEYTNMSDDDIKKKIAYANEHHIGKRGVHCKTTDEYFEKNERRLQKI